MDLVDVERVRVAITRADLVFGPDERPLGGGTWLYSEPRPGLRGLVDLTGLRWAPLEPLPDGGLRIAATCTLAELRAHPHPLFAPACDALLGSWKIHRFATVGGNICLALPAGPMTSLLAGLGAEAVIWAADGTERRVPVAELVTGVQETALLPGEVLRALELDGAAMHVRAAMRRISLADLGRSAALLVATAPATAPATMPASEPELVGGAGLGAALPAAPAFTLTVTASTPRPYRLTFASFPGADELAAAVDAIDDWYDDPHGAPDWRRAMTLRLAEELRMELRNEPGPEAGA